MRSILARKIWQNGYFVQSNKPASINGGLLNASAVAAWLVLNAYCCGGSEEWQMTFKDPGTSLNVIKGVHIQVGRESILIDGSLDDVNAKLGGCCGDNAVVTPNYPNGLPGIQLPVAKTYSVARTDDGTMDAQTTAQYDYLAYIIPNTFSRVSYNAGSGAAVYTFQSHRDPNAQKADVVTETPRVFNSNALAAPATGNVYQVGGTADGETISFKGAATLANTVTNLNNDAVYSKYGTWSQASNILTLTTTVKDVVTLVLTTVAQ